jgi:nickel superoxide dismutase
MFHKMLETLDRVFAFERARAHCDIPCGIYDPHQAQIAALTVIRMVDLMEDLAKAPQKENLEFHNTLSRYIAVKEEHAELCKREIRVIWGDYFKAEQLAKFPEVPELVHKIMQLGSQARQSTNRGTALELLSTVNRFAEIFWETKGIATKRVKAPYKPSEEVAYPVL